MFLAESCVSSVANRIPSNTYNTILKSEGAEEESTTIFDYQWEYNLTSHFVLGASACRCAAFRFL